MKTRKISNTSYIHKIIIVFMAIVVNLSVEAERAIGDEIIGFGDSITKGTPYVEEKEGDGRRVGGYEPELEALLNSEGRPSYVYNWGIGGEWTSQGVIRIDDVIGLYDHLDYVLIMEGTNDIGHMSMSSTMFNLLRMIEISRDMNVEPILATLTPDTLNVDIKKDLIPREYNPRIREMAVASQVILADQYNATIDNWSALTYDGVHPNRSGYRVLAQTWKDAILSGPSSLQPQVKTLDASAIDNTSAILNGSVNPNQNKTFYYFEYGTSEHYGNSTEKFAIGDGDTTLSVSAWITNLTPNIVYHYRIVAESEKGTSFGDDRTFVAGSAGNAPVNTSPATEIGEESARLNGSLYPGGVQTQYYFEYGIGTTYGQKTIVRDAGAGNLQVHVSEKISGLENNTIYHYRLVALRNNAEEIGNDRFFETGTGGNSGGSGSGCFITTTIP